MRLHCNNFPQFTLGKMGATLTYSYVQHIFWFEVTYLHRQDSRHYHQRQSPDNFLLLGNPTADAKGGSKPASASGSVKGSQPGSARPGSARPGSARPGSARPGSARPGSGRPGTGRTGSAKSAALERTPSGSPRPQSGKGAQGGSAGSRRSVAERLAEEQDQQLTGKHLFMLLRNALL